MFNTLLESKARKQRSPAGTAFSVVTHVVLISAAAYATAHAAIQNKKEKEEKVIFTQPPKPPPPPPKPVPPPPTSVITPPPPKGFQVLQAPTDIPDKIPDVDLTKKVTNEADFTGVGVAGGVHNGVTGATGPVNQDQVYFNFDVEKQAMAAPGNPTPKYPDLLHSAGVEGEVQVQFIIDTTGKADMESFKVLKATNDQFAQAVHDVLPRMRFYPAEVGGRKVRELVQQAFGFAIVK